MDRPVWWDEDAERLAEEVWLPVAEDFSERSGEPRSSVLKWTEMRDIAFDDPMLHDNAINNCIKIEFDPTPQQRELLKKMFGTYRAV
ncbi:hypothetical protein KRP22_006653 [Phytophthora ramorum]|nr:hypothetical protein KRP22_2218 [Phytophthora ramorum]